MLDEIVAQARDEAPNECCGIVGSRDGQAVTLYKARNARRQPARSTRSTAIDLQQSYDDIEEDGLDVGIIYHSHTRPDAEAVADRHQPRQPFPEAVYLIVGVDPPRRHARLAHQRTAQVTEAPLEVEEG